jgi:hypothetical protein
VLDASGLAVGAHLSLDGVPLGEAPLVTLVSGGRHRLTVAPPGEAVTESWVELSGRFVVPSGAAPPEAVEPDAEALARINRELQRQRPKLQVCYEKWLKADPRATGEVELHLRVAASGRVKAADVTGAPPGAPADCLVRAARALTLPALGGEVELELPLQLRSSPPP